MGRDDARYGIDVHCEAQRTEYARDRAIAAAPRPLVGVRVRVHVRVRARLRARLRVWFSG